MSMDTMVEVQLKPCPFCGSLGVAVIGSFVRCGSCGAVGPYGYNEREAVRRWNERARLPIPSSICAAASADDASTVKAE